MRWLQKVLSGGRKPAAAASAMLKKEAGNLYVLRIGSVLTKATVDRIQEVGTQEIERGAKDLKVLVVLDGFEGWRKGDDWGHIDFFASHGNDIAKIAAVGEERWRDMGLLFLLAGRRRAEVRRFMPEQQAEARVWLAG